jgi:hypothetical protein
METTETGGQTNLEPLRRVFETAPKSSSTKMIEEELERLMAHLTDADVEKAIQGYLRRRGGATITPSSQVCVRLAVANEWVLVDVFANAFVDNLVYTLVESLELKTIDSEGRPISYCLMLRRKSGEYCRLEPQLTLYEQKIEPDCDMLLFPEIVS